MKTKHDETSSRSNPLRWNCEKQGCFNRMKRPKIEVFAQCFPGHINMSDVDAEVELNSHWLRLEWKNPGVSIPKGQEINFERLARTTKTTIVVANGNAETMEVTGIEVFYGEHRKTIKTPCLDRLKNIMVHWAEHAQGTRKDGMIHPSA